MADTVIVRAGLHEVTKSVFIPSHMALAIRPGATLAMGPGVSLFSQGRVAAEGTPARPVVFTWLVPDSTWGAIALHEGGASGSTFAYCTFEHGSMATWPQASDYIKFTGTLSAYWAEVVVFNCVFEDNQGEDGINIKYAYARIDHSVFRRQGDAIDFDSAYDGVIERCQFYASVDDGIDLGGDDLSAYSFVQNNYIEGSGDKGISCGAGVSALLQNNIVVACSTGVAIKDSADPELVNNTLVGNVYGLRAYEKVGGRGGGRGRVTNTIIWESAESNVLLEDESSTALRYCDVQGGWAGEGNVDVDPGFTDFNSLQYLLSLGSSCIDAGDPLVNDDFVWPDWYSNAERSDMGAYGGARCGAWFAE